jgi:tRNA1(Val) A37 N6-methylase TrmN6
MRSRPVESSQVPFAVTDDAILGGRLKLLQPVRGHRAGHDAILLAAAAPKSVHAIELGAGVGAAGLSLLVRGAARDLVRLAAANAERNNYGGRAEAVACEVERVARRGGPARPAAASADLVIMNPPFNDPETRRASPDAARRRAHAAPVTSLEHWVAAAARLLKDSGRLVLIHRPEAIATILALVEGQFGAIEIIPVHALASGPAIRIILRAQKGKRTPPVIRRCIVLAGDDGRPTHEADEILRGAAALDPA